MPAPAELLELVERFRRNLDDYRSGRYKEARLRSEFLDPFFELLGWDVDNTAGLAEAYKDVIHEDAIKLGGGTKAPDYCFRVGGTRKFFVEAKKPSEDIKHSTDHAFQLRRYAWSAKLPVSVLTDFEELAVYECKRRPKRTDKASKHRVRYYTFDNYHEAWDDIAGILSKDAVLKGDFDRFVERELPKRGTAEVDDAFLKEIERWRETLAKDIARRNRKLTQKQVNFAVQRTIDRIIFLRIAEDRGMEGPNRLQGQTNGTGVYKRLFALFRDADQKYNSGLFHFEGEKGRETAPDELTPGLQVDDEVVRDIVRGLYYPESPYEFSVLPADILGQVYEQFLGKVIRLTGKGAKVEYKPEVRKAGGVYYTPTYIVDYIVENTVGKLLEKAKTPAKAAKLKVLDPACGSGSFLLGAYRKLLDWHLDHYSKHDPEKWTRKRPPRIYQGPRGEWRLTLNERKRILTDNIFGVDISEDAVEVTKLSLLLKVLEDVSGEAIHQWRLFAKERALPDLGKNIKCGNSLIGTDYWEGRQETLLDTEEDEEERLRVNAFDWQTEFADVFKGKNPGFDAVIGNPPYIRIQALKEWAPTEVEFYKKQYVSASKGNYDIYVVFVERGVSLLNNHGRLGFILPSKFLSTDYGASLRGYLARLRVVDQIVDFGHEQVFGGATTYTCLLLLGREQPKAVEHVRIAPAGLFEEPRDTMDVAAKSLGEEPWLFLGAEAHRITDKLQRSGIPLLELPVAMSRGTSTGLDEVFCLVEDSGTLKTRDGRPIRVERDVLRKPLYATDFTRYSAKPKNNERIIFPYTVSETGYELLEESVLRDRWPKTYAYLRSERKRLTTRKQARKWYGYSAPRNLHLHDGADFLVPLLADQGLCAPVPQKNHRFCVMASAGFSVTLGPSDMRVNPLYVLGLVNSRLLFWGLSLASNKFRGGWITCTKQYFGKLPVRTIDFSDADDKRKHDRMVALVRRMLDLNKKLPAAKTPHAKEVIERDIAATDRRIDLLVYELYGLTKKEIGIVEEAAAKSN